MLSIWLVDLIVEVLLLLLVLVALSEVVDTATVLVATVELARVFTPGAVEVVSTVLEVIPWLLVE